jgi:hypothetical protein
MFCYFIKHGFEVKPHAFNLVIVNFVISLSHVLVNFIKDITTKDVTT